MREFIINDSLQLSYLEALWFFQGSLVHEQLSDIQKDRLRDSIEHTIDVLDRYKTPYWVQNHILCNAQKRDIFKGHYFNSVLFSGKYGITKESDFKIIRQL